MYQLVLGLRTHSSLHLKEPITFQHWIQPFLLSEIGPPRAPWLVSSRVQALGLEVDANIFLHAADWQMGAQNSTPPGCHTRGFWASRVSFTTSSAITHFYWAKVPPNIQQPNRKSIPLQALGLVSWIFCRMNPTSTSLLVRICFCWSTISVHASTPFTNVAIRPAASIGPSRTIPSTHPTIFSLLQKETNSWSIARVSISFFNSRPAFV